MTDGKRIAVYGATGYTGRQVVGELTRRGAIVVAVGRDGQRVAEVAAEHGCADSFAADLADHGALVAAFGGCGAVVNCVGPFGLSAVPVASAAIAVGAHYLDFTAEQEAVLALFEDCGPGAARAGVALVPAMGFFGALGDMLAAITAEGLADLERIEIAYRVEDWLLTHGSRDTVGYMSGKRRAWRDSKLELLEGTPEFGSFDYPDGPAAVMEGYPLPEAITVPLHTPAPTVRLMMASSTLTQIFAPDAPAPEDVSDRQRAASRFVIAVVAHAAGARRQTVARGADIYGITAPIISQAALDLLTDGHRAGALAPSQAFEPASFLSALEPHGVVLETTQPKP